MTTDTLKGEVHILCEVMPFPCMIQSHAVYIAYTDVHVEGTELTAKGTIIWLYCLINPSNDTFRASQCRRIIVLLVHMLHVSLLHVHNCTGSMGNTKGYKSGSLLALPCRGGKRIKLPYLSKEADSEMWVHWDLI